SFEHLDHTPTCCTVVDGGSAIEYAIAEVFEFRFQSFRLFHLGGPHISGTITHEQLIDLVSGIHPNTLVVDLEFLVGLEVVPNHHPFLPSYQCGADLNGRQPVHVDMGNDVAWKVDGDKRHVHVPVQMFFPSSNDGFRLFLDDVVHD